MSEQHHGWERLAGLLVDRRVQLSPEYRNRLKFAADTGLNERLISDLENARRERYRATSLRAVEAAYRWEFGSIERVVFKGLDPIELTPPGGFGTQSEFPGIGVEGRSTGWVIDDVATKPKRIPSWLGSEIDRRNIDPTAVVGYIEALKNLASHYGYTLAELLLNAGLATESDLVINERPASQSGALADFDDATTQIAASRHLTDQQRREILDIAARVRKEIEEGLDGN